MRDTTISGSNRYCQLKRSPAPPTARVPDRSLLPFCQIPELVFKRLVLAAPSPRRDLSTYTPRCSTQTHTAANTISSIRSGCVCTGHVTGTEWPALVHILGLGPTFRTACEKHHFLTAASGFDHGCESQRQKRQDNVLSIVERGHRGYESHEGGPADPSTVIELFLLAESFTGITLAISQSLVSGTILAQNRYVRHGKNSPASRVPILCTIHELPRTPLFIQNIGRTFLLVSVLASVSSHPPRWLPPLPVAPLRPLPCHLPRPFVSICGTASFGLLFQDIAATSRIPYSLLTAPWTSAGVIETFIW